jgi:hypothetical protein
MRYILIILVFLSVGAKAQMVIKAHANYRPYAQPAVNLLLDDYPNAAAAYSLRNLSSTYTGPLIRVRKDTTGQPEMDIYGDYYGNLDTVGLKNFLNARSGWVTTWYDQSGNNRNAVQNTGASQPFIVSSGVVQRIANKPTVVFLSASNFTVNFNGVSNATHFHVGQTSTLNSASTIFLQGDANTKWYLPVSSGSSGAIYSNVGTPTTYFNGVLNTATTQGQLYTNLINTNVIASITNANTSTWTGINFDLTGTSAYESIRFRSELIIYNSDQSSNRTGIENNINDYYNIYWNGDFTGLLDTYGSSAAAYSLRNLSSTYTGPLIRVRKDTTGQPEMDIYGDYYGNLDTVGLKNFVGAGNNGFVTVWYDQSGNARNATQTTAASQRRIVVSGTIQRENGKPVIIDGSVFSGYTITYFDVSQNWYVFSTVKPSTVASQQVTIGHLGPGGVIGQIYLGFGRSSRQYLTWYNAYLSNSTNALTTNQQLLTYFKTGTTSNWSYGYFTNGAANGSFTNSGNPPNITTNFGLGSFYSPMIEFIIYTSNQSSNRTGIENNINSYYSIY